MRHSYNIHVNSPIRRKIMQALHEAIEDTEELKSEPMDLDREELSQWCRSFGDFSYIYNIPLRGWKLCNANSSELQQEIANDVMECDHIESTDRMDWLLYHKMESLPNRHYSVFKLCYGDPSKDYYVVYEAD